MKSAISARQVGKIRSQKADKAARSQDRLKQGERLHRDLANLPDQPAKCNIVC